MLQVIRSVLADCAVLRNTMLFFALLCFAGCGVVWYGAGWCGMVRLLRLRDFVCSSRVKSSPSLNFHALDSKQKYQ